MTISRKFSRCDWINFLANWFDLIDDYALSKRLNYMTSCCPFQSELLYHNTVFIDWHNVLCVLRFPV